MLPRPGLALYLAPRQFPFVLIGGVIAVLGYWSPAPTAVAVMTAFLVAFQVKGKILTKPCS
ncbi:hypothetical protein [Streptomyces griseoaurantiacus]|uniref:hypothetical protein n=1 Tax=Streptomyces griseoaurantiacus TaxID=68213 RepID=UPI0034609661